MPRPARAVSDRGTPFAHHLGTVRCASLCAACVGVDACEVLTVRARPLSLRFCGTCALSSGPGGFSRELASKGAMSERLSGV